MEFLYRSMDRPDVTDYPREFYEENIEKSLEARKKLPWGKIVPEREFKYFVLPVRVNNEALDSARGVFYKELYPRVKDLSMTEAALEINRWCQEKVSYKPSDSRTSTPLATMRSAIGRCGEESTFAVAAFRAMCIPARQVYTPRWAHTDDNHAWVEVWVDGEWHFLGACEPEAVLDLGWFNAPATRGMLMSTKAIGKYDGPEEVVSESATYREINVTSIYAPVDTFKVEVLDIQGNPVKAAKVAFRLYNYAEFYPLTWKVTDNEGNAQFIGGLGDLLVWASTPDGKYSGHAIAKPGKTLTIKLIETDKIGAEGEEKFDIAVPPARAIHVEVPAEKRAENERLKARGDSIRHAYEATFQPDGFMNDSRGNWQTIKDFVAKTEKSCSKAILSNISEKDRRDINMLILNEMRNFKTDTSQLAAQYILTNRIDNEHLSPFRGYFLQNFTQKEQKAFKNDPRKLVKWVDENITLDNEYNPRRLVQKPSTVHLTKKGDPRSRDIMFVALARTMNIPARLNPINGKPQYIPYSFEGKDIKKLREISAMPEENWPWEDVIFADAAAESGKTASPKGKLQLKYKPSGKTVEVPSYYIHFTISKIENGQPVLMNFDETADFQTLFGKPVTLDEGQYVITSGQRLANGNVLALNRYFTISEGKTSEVDFTVRNDDSQVQIIGNFNSENLYHDANEGVEKSILSTTGRGYYVLGVLKSAHEPSTHAINDLIAAADRLNNYDVKILLLADKISENDLARLPKNVVVGKDINNSIENEIVSNLKLSGNDKPYFIIADTFNRVVFSSNGYTIGLGATIADILQKVM